MSNDPQIRKRGGAAMGPLQRAEAVISRARGRHSNAVCPGDARSPMDADVTITVPRAVISACDEQPKADLQSAEPGNVHGTRP